MALSDEARKKLADLLYAMRKLVNDGNLEVDWYHKALVDGAHECMVAGDYDWALDLLGKVPPDYYSDVMSVHMEMDPGFAAKAFQIAKVLIATSAVHVGFTEEEQNNVQEV